MWSRPEIVVTITLGREKLMQHMLLGVHQVTEQCIVVVLDELSCRWPVSRVETGPDSTTDDSFDAMSIICRREAPPGTGRVEQFGNQMFSNSLLGVEGTSGYFRRVVETVRNRIKLVLITNWKSHMGFRLVPKSVALNDPERRNSPYFALFHRIR